jgi:hypothetical protein
VLKGNLGAPAAIEKGYKVYMHGYNQSLDYQESGADFMQYPFGVEIPGLLSIIRRFSRLTMGCIEGSAIRKSEMGK